MPWRRLLALVCLVGAWGGLSAGSTAHSGSMRAERMSARLKQSPIRWIAVRHLAQGKLPASQTFSILGERYRFQGRVYFTLAVSINRPGEPAGGGGGGGFNPSQRQGVFAYSAIAACTPHPYAVVFGVLRAPADRVVARRGDHATILKHAPIPAVLHAHGLLAYAPLGGPPTAVTVRTPDGKRLLNDKLFGGRCSPGVAIVLQSH